MLLPNAWRVLLILAGLGCVVAPRGLQSSLELHSASAAQGSSNGTPMSTTVLATATAAATAAATWMTAKALSPSVPRKLHRGFSKSSEPMKVGECVASPVAAHESDSDVPSASDDDDDQDRDLFANLDGVSDDEPQPSTP